MTTKATEAETAIPPSIRCLYDPYWLNFRASLMGGWDEEGYGFNCNVLRVYLIEQKWSMTACRRVENHLWGVSAKKGLNKQEVRELRLLVKIAHRSGLANGEQYEVLSDEEILRRWHTLSKQEKRYIKTDLQVSVHSWSPAIRMGSRWFLDIVAEPNQQNTTTTTER